MSTLTRPRLLSVEDYLEGEAKSDIKHEYVAGRVYAMVGTSKAHNRIAGNLYAALLFHLRGGPCQVYMADIKVRVEQAQVFYYPDIAVTCDPADNDPYVVTRPRLIVEVLSPTTERVDQGEKLYNYRQLESLQEYALVSPERREVQVYRCEQDAWRMETYGEGERMRFDSVDFMIPVTEIFAGV